MEQPSLEPNVPKVFDYADPVDFLNAFIQSVQERNPQFSLRSWSKQLGLSHVAMLSMVLNRKRRLLPSLSSKISAQFLHQGRFTQNEARYFDMLVLFSNASTIDEKNFYQRILSELRPDREFVTLDLDRVRLLADWYHIAILEMTYLKDFKSDPRWICLRLGDSVNERQVKDAIDRLVRLGLLEHTEQGLRKTQRILESPSDIPSDALREFHSQMIQRSIGAMKKQAVHDREISSETMAISKERLPEAKRMIRDFRKKLSQFLESDQNDAVYQLNVQLFNVLES
ncbi:MAG: DUF4423 domain-containing protein [Bdellovibrionia bacterium]